MSRYPEIDPSALHSRPFSSDPTRVRFEQFAGPPRPGATFAQFLDSLPHILAGESLRRVACRILEARKKNRAVVVCCGGHVIKCGLAPILIELMDRGIVTAIAMNGAAAIHDMEIALFGSTSETVEHGLPRGTFGFSQETASVYNGAFAEASREGSGAGEVLGRRLVDAPCAARSALAGAYHLHIPLTIHVAIGTDIVHMHACADGAALGEASLRDFRILAAAMQNLSDGGVLLNIGSAVILPEVLLKVMAMLRNLDPKFGRFLGVDLDFMNQHRAYLQVVRRVEALGGEGIALTGHHEILVPLLAQAVVDFGSPCATPEG